jgi:2-methylcitrate dehydratase PrpD
VGWTQLPPAVQEMARQCVLDWLAVALAGAGSEVVRRLLSVLREEMGAPVASVLRRSVRCAPGQAALVNGTASHALDYDDVNAAMQGHPSVPLLPALFAMAEAEGHTGQAMLAAFVAGYEFECRVGAAVAPGHYARGFHATATVGALGATVAVAHLRGLTPECSAHALGIAATQTAGLKSLFGTDCKPMHAGRAAQLGIWSTMLAARGFTAREDILECPQGFAETHAERLDSAAALSAPRAGHHLLDNLFKFHASCFETHATLEACASLRSSLPAEASAVRAVEVQVNPYCERMCNIHTPVDGLQAKFSLRQMAAFALAGIPTSDPAVFAVRFINAPEVLAWRDRVVVKFDPRIAPARAHVRVILGGEKVLEANHDAALPASDLDMQRARLVHKAQALLEPIAGTVNTRALIEACLALDSSDGLQVLLAAVTRLTPIEESL